MLSSRTSTLRASLGCAFSIPCNPSHVRPLPHPSCAQIVHPTSAHAQNNLFDLKTHTHLAYTCKPLCHHQEHCFNSRIMTQLWKIINFLIKLHSQSYLNCFNFLTSNWRRTIPSNESYSPLEVKLAQILLKNDILTFAQPNANPFESIMHSNPLS